MCFIRLFLGIIVAISLINPVLAENRASKCGGCDHASHGKGNNSPEARQLNAIYDQALKDWADYKATGVIATYDKAVSELATYEGSPTPKGYRTKPSFTDTAQCCGYQDDNNNGIDDGFEGFDRHTGTTGNFDSSHDVDGIGGIP